MEQLSAYALRLFERGRSIARRQNLILADTKYEFGHIDGVITLMDEIHTPDSSRYFEAEGFEKGCHEGKSKNNSVRNSYVNG